MNNIELLKKAREKIAKEENWTQHTFMDANGCMCALGAIGCTLHEDTRSWTDPFRQVEVSEMMEIGNFWLGKPNKIHSVATFNDSPTTDHKDVLAMFDYAIEYWEAKPIKRRWMEFKQKLGRLI